MPPPPGSSALPAALVPCRNVWRPAFRRAFSLVELLVVMTIIVLILGLLGRVFTASPLDPGIAGISSTLEQARAYAMANNTYVYLGFAEVDISQDATASPQALGVGRIVAAAVASKDGTRGYDINDPQATWATNYGNGSNLVAVSRIQKWDNVHLGSFGTLPTSGNMLRASVSSSYQLGSGSCKSVTPLAWPLGNTLTNGQYNFTKVIQFDPQGVARIQYGTNADNIVSFMEADLQPTRGNIQPITPADQNTGNQAAVQIDAMTGVVRIFRP